MSEHPAGPSTLGADILRMLPVWAVVFVTAIGALFGIRALGVGFISAGDIAQKDTCAVAEAMYLAGMRDYRGIARRVDSDGGRPVSDPGSLGVLEGDGEVRELAEAMGQALALCPRMAGAHRVLADLAWWAGDQALAHYHLGREAATDGRPLDARVHYLAAADMAPAEPRYVLTVAWLDAEDFRWDAAAERLESLGPDARESALGLRIRGLVALQQERFDEGRDLILESLAKEPGHPDSIRALVRFYARGDRVLDGAEIAFDSLLRAQAPDATSYHSVALLFMQEGEWERAHAALSRAVQMAPHAISLLFDKAVCEYRLGRYGDAYVTSERARAVSFQEYQRLVSESRLDPAQGP